jgi:hypothetical protein
MIRIAITAEAFEAVAAILPGNDGYEREPGDAVSHSREKVEIPTLKCDLDHSWGHVTGANMSETP